MHFGVADRRLSAKSGRDGTCGERCMARVHLRLSNRSLIVRQVSRTLDKMPFRGVIRKGDNHWLSAGEDQLSKYSFGAEERYAVYTVHGERCYLCGKPIDFASMEVDHVIPGSLLGSKGLADVLD